MPDPAAKRKETASRQGHVKPELPIGAANDNNTQELALN